MTGSAILGLALLAAAPARASTDGTPPAPTGTPSDATSTVSPATVAAAASRADGGDGGSSFDVSVGTSIAHGTFGTGRDSRIVSSALGVRYSIGTFRISASVPYLNIRSRSLIYSGIDSTPVIVAAVRTPAPRVTHDGIGDLTVGAAYSLPEAGAVPEIELSGRVKLPTASRASQLSTRKTDWSVGLQLTKTVGRFAPFVSTTYRMFGDPAQVSLRNGFAASAGTSVGLGGRAVALASYHYAAAASRLVRNAHELFAGVSEVLPHSRLRVTAFATAGLSSGAAASSGGLSLSLNFR